MKPYKDTQFKKAVEDHEEDHIHEQINTLPMEREKRGWRMGCGILLNPLNKYVVIARNQRRGKKIK